MTKEEIDILWNKALRDSVEDGSLYTRYRFAELVAEAERNRTWKPEDWTEYERSIAAAAKAEEREACAKVCDELSDKHTWEGCYADECAQAIRARGETK